MNESASTGDGELLGGAQSVGLVRIGDAVRRVRYPNAPFVQELLIELEHSGFAGAPRYLGSDEDGRQLLSYLPGTVPAGPPFRLSDAQLVSATRLIRGYHDRTEHNPLRREQEVVCHGDLGPFNTVYEGERAVALIDFGDEVAPGTRASDFAHAVWCFGDLTEPDVPIGEQVRKAELMCRVYPPMTPADVIGELRRRFLRAREPHARAGHVGPVRAFDRLLTWLDENESAFRAVATSPTPTGDAR